MIGTIVHGCTSRLTTVSSSETGVTTANKITPRVNTFFLDNIKSAFKLLIMVDSQLVERSSKSDKEEGWEGGGEGAVKRVKWALCCSRGFLNPLEKMGRGS